MLNTLSESPLYDIAAMWGRGGVLIGAMNMGNGSAGAINITIETVIRLAVAAASGDRGAGVQSADAAARAVELSMTLFLSLMIAMSLSCVPVYVYMTRRIPTLKAKLAAAETSRRVTPLHARPSATIFKAIRHAAPR